MTPEDSWERLLPSLVAPVWAAVAILLVLGAFVVAATQSAVGHGL